MRISWSISEDTAGWRSWDRETGTWRPDFEMPVSGTEDRLLERPVLRIYGSTSRGDGIETAEVKVELDELLDWVVACHRGRRALLEALLRAEHQAGEADTERRYLEAMNASRPAWFDPATSPYDPWSSDEGD